MNGPARTILIADADESSVMYLSVVLGRMGYAVVAAQSGEEVVKLLDIAEPDLLIIDRDLPVLDGIETLRRVREHPRQGTVPFVIIATGADDRTREACRRLGASACLVKPLSVAELHAVLQEHVVHPSGKKRRHLRVAFGRKVVVTVAGVSHDHDAVNLSEGGVYVGRPEPYPVGTPVEVALPLDGLSLRLHGEVIYTRRLYGDGRGLPPGMAIEFRNVGPGDAEALGRHVAALLTLDAFPP